jgi:hypothetical protein
MCAIAGATVSTSTPKRLELLYSFTVFLIHWGPHGFKSRNTSTSRGQFRLIDTSGVSDTVWSWCTCGNFMSLAPFSPSLPLSLLETIMELDLCVASFVHSCKPVFGSSTCTPSVPISWQFKTSAKFHLRADLRVGLAIPHRCNLQLQLWSYTFLGHLRICNC